MALIRAFLNNGFFVLVLIVAVTLYLAYSDSVKRDHGLLDKPSNHVETEAQPVEQELVTTTETNVPEAVDTLPIIEKPATQVIEPVVEETTQTTTEETPVESMIATTEPVVETAENVAETVSETVVEVATEIAPAVTPLANKEEPKPSPEAVVETPKESIIPTQVTTKQATFEFPVYDEANLQAILDDKSLTEGVPEFATVEEAYAAARQAFYDKDYLTSEKIYFSMARKNPTANAVGELGNVLFVDGKKEWANRAWLESAKLLIQENRVKDAYTLANRLHPVAPETARKIGYQLAKMMAAKHTQNLAEKQGQPRNNTMPPMQNMHPMVQPQFQSQPMPAMQMDPRMMEMQKAQQERQRAFMEQMRQQQMQPPAHMPTPQYQPAPNSSMPPMTAPQFKPQPMPPMQPMQMDPRMLEMQKAQEERRKAFMEKMRQQQMQPPAQMPPPQFKPMPYGQIPPMVPMNAPQMPPQVAPQGDVSVAE